LRYLLVDDNKDFLASAKRLLDSQGADVVGCATSSAEALRLTDELRPDVALVERTVSSLQDGSGIRRRRRASF
jgi:CheY-like chemotaxis protein